MMSQPPVVLKIGRNLRGAELHHRQPRKSAAYRQTKQKVGEGVSRPCHWRELPWRIHRQLRREDRLERQGADRVRVSIQMPPSTVAKPGAAGQIMSPGAVSQLFIQLPGVIVIADVAIASAEGRIPLQVDRGYSSAVERVRNPDRIQNRSQADRLVSTDRPVPQKTKPQAVHQDR